MEYWRKNLYVIVIAEFLVIMGFSFVGPFMPLFIQELGHYTDEQTALWSGIATGASSIAMFLSSPIWGLLADRWGRKPMLLRSLLGLGAAITLVGLSPNVYWLVAFRFAQGFLGGTVAAASALVAASTPREKTPFAMGLLMVAVYAGSTVGPMLGGVLADLVGFRQTFYVAGVAYLVSALMVLFLVKETFVRPDKANSVSVGDVLSLGFSRQMLPLLIVIAALHIGPQMISPVIPLVIQGLSSAGAAARTSGLAFALMGVTAAVSSFAIGRIGRRLPLRNILVVCCIATGLLYLPPIWIGTVGQMVFLVGITGLLTGGMLTASNTLISQTVPGSQAGIAYGIAQSASALGMGLGPLIGGGLGSYIGLRPVFGVAGVFFIVVGVVVTRLLKKKP